MSETLAFPLLEPNVPLCPSSDFALGELGGKLYYVDEENDKITHDQHTDDSNQLNYSRAGGVTYPVARMTSQGARIVNSKHEANVKTRSWRKKSFWEAIPALEKAHRFLSEYVPVTNVFFSYPSDVGSSARRRDSSMVKAVAFHPHLMKIAVAVQQAPAFGDTDVLIYDVVKSEWEEHAMKHHMMKDVASMVWKPQSEGTLIVGCAKGIFVWSTQLRLENAGHTGACVFYSFRDDPSICVTAMDTSISGKFLVAGSSSSTLVCYYDLSKAPHKACVMSTNFFDGPTSCVVFSAESRWVLRSSSTSKTIFAINCKDMSRKAIAVAAPCEEIVPCWDRRAMIDSVAITNPTPAGSAAGDNYTSRPLHNFFALQLRAVEGVLLAQLDNTTGELSLKQSIVTGSIPHHLVEGASANTISIGGAVAKCVVSNHRMYVHLAGGYVLILSIDELTPETSTERCLSVRPIASFGCSLDYALEPFHGFTHGSLVAVVKPDATMHFVPSYHNSCDPSE